MKSRFAHQKSTITYLSIILILQLWSFTLTTVLSILYKQWHAAQYSPNSVTYCTSVLLGFFNFSVRKISLLSSRVWSVAFLGCVAYHVQERSVCGERESYILRTRHIKCWLLYKHCHIAALCNNFSSSRSPWYQWFSLTLLKCFVRFW